MGSIRRRLGRVTRRVTRRRAGLVVAWSAAATVGLAAVTGAATSLAFADPTPSPTTPTASASAEAKRADAPDGRRLRGVIARRAVHGEVVIRKKDGAGYVTVVHQRGTVVTADADSVTVKSTDGFTRNYAVTSATRVRVSGKQAEIGDVEAGTAAVVVGVREGNTLTARLVAAGMD